MPRNITLRKHLKKVRKERALTQAQAARVIGCTTKTYGNWELGYLSPFAVYRPHIERFLGYRIDIPPKKRRKRAAK